jgi:hypothetical protein
MLNCVLNFFNVHIIMAAKPASPEILAQVQELAAEQKLASAAAHPPPPPPVASPPPAANASSAIGSMVKSLALTVPSSFLAGAALSKRNLPRAVPAVFLSIVLMSYDGLSRNGVSFRNIALVSLFISLLGIVPWAATYKDPKVSEAVLPRSLGAASLLFLIWVTFTSPQGNKTDAARGALIALMYAYLSGSIGWHGAQAQKSPLHRGWSLYSVALFIILFIFDFISQWK